MSTQEEKANEQEDTNTRSCMCAGARGITDARLLVFGMQVGFGILSCGFYMYQLTKGGSDSIYLPLLTATIATFLPNPSFKK